MKAALTTEMHRIRWHLVSKFRGLLAVAICLVLMPVGAFASDDGLVWVGSSHSASATADRLQATFKSKGVTLFARIDHAAGARSVGQPIPPTQLLIFGNPKLGTPLIQCQASTAIDLPLKMLISEDAAGRVWITYTDPGYLAKRHKLQGCDAVIGKMTHILGGFARAAASP